MHAQDCISANAVRARCVRTVHHLDHVHHARSSPPATSARSSSRTRGSACRAAVAAEVAPGWGSTPTVIPNGVDAARFAAAPAERRRARARGGGDGSGATCSRSAASNRARARIDLLEAFALLATDQPDVRLVIAGGETLFDYREYRDEFDAPGRRARRRHRSCSGPVDDDELPALVAAGAASFAFLSTKEGFGLAAMEALAAGVPSSRATCRCCARSLAGRSGTRPPTRRWHAP